MTELIALENVHHIIDAVEIDAGVIADIVVGIAFYEPVTGFVLFVHGSEHKRRHRGNIINIRFTYSDSLHIAAETAGSGVVNDIALSDVNRVIGYAVINAVFFAGNAVRQLQSQFRNAVDERDAFAVDGEFAIGLFGYDDLHVLRQIINQKIALIAEIVRVIAGNLPRGDLLIDVDNFICQFVDFVEPNANLIVSGFDLILQLNGAVLHHVGNNFTLLDDVDAIGGSAGVRRQIDPRLIKLHHRVLNAGAGAVVENRLKFIVIDLNGFEIIIRRGFLPELFIGINIAGAHNGFGIDAGAYLNETVRRRLLKTVSRCQIDPLTRIAFRARVYDVMTGRILHQLMCENAAHHCIETGEC